MADRWIGALLVLAATTALVHAFIVTRKNPR